MTAAKTAYPWELYPQNVLTIKDGIGHAKDCTYNLPPKDYYYGTKLQYDKEGAGEVIHSWKYPKLSRDMPSQRNYVKLNKASTRDPNAIKEKPSDYRILYKREGNLVQPVYLPYEEFSYGIESGQPESMGKIMGNHYGNEAEDEIGKNYSFAATMAASAAQRNARSGPLVNRGARYNDLRHEHNWSKVDELSRPPRPLFKLARFKDIYAKTATRFPNANRKEDPQELQRLMDKLEAKQGQEEEKREE